MTVRIDLARLVRFEETPNGQRWRVGHGDGREGSRGRQIGLVALKHARDFEVVLQLDNGRIDTFSPFQLFPDTEQAPGLFAEVAA